MNKEVLLSIDPQNDFCDPNGALYVGGAEKDMDNLASFIKKYGKKLHDIHVSLDSHQEIHIAHPIFWINDKGEHPSPFTVICKDDVINGVWKAARPTFQKRAEDYVTKLKKDGRYVLCIWPPHCRVGSWGFGVFPSVFDALSNWEKENFAKVGFVTKGNNPFTEHYSIVKADVEDPSDPTTKLNTGFIDVLKEADKIFITGEALSHCVANSITDIATAFGDENIKKFVLLEDTSSNVTGFERLGQEFVNKFVSKGMQLAKTTDF